jgi:hypothetical protein
MRAASFVLFANAKLVGIPLFEEPLPAEPVNIPVEQRVGLGFANFREIDEIVEKRKSPSPELLQFKKTLLGANATLAIYFGGANDTYYNDAFPRFLAILTEASQTHDLSSLAIAIQQHPRSVWEGNRDGRLLEEWQKTSSKQSPRVFISPCGFNDALATADLAFYYQTGAATRFMLVGIPTAQIGHEPYVDTLVGGKFCPSIKDKKQFIEALSRPAPDEETQKKIASESGMDPQWPAHLNSFLEKL